MNGRDYCDFCGKVLTDPPTCCLEMRTEYADSLDYEFERDLAEEARREREAEQAQADRPDPPADDGPPF
jgi:hypothetical protein